MDQETNVPNGQERDGVVQKVYIKDKEGKVGTGKPIQQMSTNNSARLSHHRLCVVRQGPGGVGLLGSSAQMPMPIIITPEPSQHANVRPRGALRKVSSSTTTREKGRQNDKMQIEGSRSGGSTAGPVWSAPPNPQRSGVVVQCNVVQQHAQRLGERFIRAA